jgi:hypothetical protein
MELKREVLMKLGWKIHSILVNLMTGFSESPLKGLNLSLRLKSQVLMMSSIQKISRFAVLLVVWGLFLFSFYKHELVWQAPMLRAVALLGTSRS